MNTYFFAKWLSPSRSSTLLKMLDLSISRAIEYFQRLERVEFDAILALKSMVNSVIEPRLEFMSQRAEMYKKWWSDPFIKIIDPDYDWLSDKKDNQYFPIEKIDCIMLECLQASKLSNIQPLLRKLDLLDDSGGYGTTHILYGCNLLVLSGVFRYDELSALMDKSALSIKNAQSRSDVNDLFFERTAFLIWLGYHTYVAVSWIHKIILSQLQNGGWSEESGKGPISSNQHSSCLALTSLILYKKLITPK